MIYNAKLTSRLVKDFGEEVLTWNKSVIRSTLENAVMAAGALVLDSKYGSLRNMAHSIYTDLKELDDEFTTEYMGEIDELIKHTES